jgi:hypothetical protein
MADIQTKPTQVNPDDFIDTVENDRRRSDAKQLIAIFREVTGMEAVMWGPAIIGFGTTHYKYESGWEGDMPTAGFSPRKQNLALYLSSGYPEYEDLLSKLGKHKKAVSCLYLNKLSDADPEILREMIAAGFKSESDKCG